MAGRLNLPTVCDNDPLGMSCKAERVLDSPDSGLPPSPGPSAWCPGEKGATSPVTEDESRGSSSSVPILPIGSVPQREGIARAPLQPRDIRYSSEVHYDSRRHFIQEVDLQPRGLGLKHCSQTVIALPHSTWRHYKTQLYLQPRLRPQRFQTTTIVYPKYPVDVYTTELLGCDSRRVPILSIGSVPQRRPLSYGEGIARAPLQPKEIRYSSAVRYDSRRHFIQEVDLQPRGLGLEHCSQTVIALPHSTWRHYKTQLYLQPRLRPQRFQTTTIVYPKHLDVVDTTRLSYDSRQVARRFLSSVTLEATGHRRLSQCGVATPVRGGYPREVLLPQ